jgi:FdhD protein
LETPLPRLTTAHAPLTRVVEAVNAQGELETVSIPAERALTVYVDKRELVTLMTLGAHPEWLVLGFLRNQRLVQSAQEIESITVDWDVGVAAVKTHAGIANLEAKTAKRVITTGCGQGSVFGDMMDEVDAIHLPDATLTQAQLYGITNTIRLLETTYQSAGSVHGCALFGIQPEGPTLLIFVEDVGRHNAIDTIAGWMWMQDMAPASAAGSASRVFYTTGRLTSEMVIKSAQMDVPIVVSRSGITQMGHEVAQRIGLCTIGRATHKRFLCYTAVHRLILQPELAGARPVAG